MIPFIFKTNYKVRQNSKRKEFQFGLLHMEFAFINNGGSVC